ncbi:MAG: acyloxyacyl hydrolase [Bacteroidales bacterium]|nr:acyloxyacyl hydrolase [Bacteroidales bacterium]MDZ4205233.1 acyloxyacyl hydrolase [Bacteroidales bacterium]
MRPYTSGTKPAFEVQVGYRRNSQSAYNRIFNYPAIGLSLYRGSPGKKEVVGNVTSALMFMEFTLREKQASALRVKYSFGLAHFSTYYDSETNPVNEAIGAPINVHVNLNLTYNYYYHESLDLTLGLGLTHFSNGAYKMPNKGINMYDINAGLRYYLHPRETHPRFDNKKMVVVFQPLLRFQTIATAGIMQIDDDPVYYPVSDLSLNLSVQSQFKTRGGIGFDLFYNGYTYRMLKSEVENFLLLNSLRGGIYGAFELDFNRLAVVYNLGFYVFYKAEPIKPMYQKVGLRYRLNDRVFAALSLKAHRNKAEYTQLGLGYTIISHSMKKGGYRGF